MTVVLSLRPLVGQVANNSDSMTSGGEVNQKFLQHHRVVLYTKSV